MPRERSSSLERLKKKLRRLERKLDERCERRSRSRSRSSLRTPSSRSHSPRGYWESRPAHIRSTSPSRDAGEILEINTQGEADQPAVENAGDGVMTNEQAEVEISQEILDLLGKAPEEIVYGPEILPQLCSRWQVIIKKGMEKEEKAQLIKKYPPPGNCKIIDAPKLNPEAQAAAGDIVLKRDKAIEAKQKEISCAMSAVGQALNKLCRSSGNEDVIGLLSDGARLLGDYLHSESLTRKHFILTGIENKSAREAIRDTEVDQWLFGENLAEKLKASKAIERSSKDLRSTNNKPRKITTNHLNSNRPANVYRPKGPVQKSGFYQQHKKQPGHVPTKPYQQKTRYNQRYSNRR